MAWMLKSLPFFNCNLLDRAGVSNSVSLWHNREKKNVKYITIFYAILNCTCWHVLPYSMQWKNCVNCKFWGSDRTTDEDSSLVNFQTTLKVESGSSSETLVTIYQATQHHIPKNLNLQLCELIDRKHIPLNGWTQTEIFACMFEPMFNFSRFSWLVWVYHGLDICVAGCWLICLNSHPVIHWLFQ